MKKSLSRPVAIVPAKPAWLEPRRLGAEKLRFIPREQVCIIKGGRLGVAEYLRKCDPAEDLKYRAFVIERPNGSKYVYSRKQFWLAAHGLLDFNRRHQLNRSILADTRHILERVPDYHRALHSSDEDIKGAVEKLFNIRDYAQALRTTSRNAAKGPAVVETAGKVVGVAVPQVPSTQTIRRTPHMKPSSKGPFNVSDTFRVEV